MSYTDEEYKIYVKVKHEMLLEDAKNYVADWIANERGCYVSDLTDEELDRYDYEDLVFDFENHSDWCDPTADVWENIVNDYMEDNYQDEE